MSDAGNRSLRKSGRLRIQRLSGAVLWRLLGVTLLVSVGFFMGGETPEGQRVVADASLSEPRGTDGLMVWMYVLLGLTLLVSVTGVIVKFAARCVVAPRSALRSLMGVALVAVVFGTVDAALYGLIKTFVCSRLMDTVLYGLDTARVAYIITDRWREVSRALLEMRRGVTLLQGQGAYTGAEKHVLLVAFKQREVVQVKRLLREIDPAAFFIVCDAHEIFGEGFGDYQKEEI